MAWSPGDIALLGLAAGAIGWIATRISERVAEEGRRRAKLLDLQRALRAEIRAYVDQLTEIDLDEHLSFMIARIEEGGDGAQKFVPFIPRERRDTIYRASLGDLQLLPQPVIEPVVLFYASVQSISGFADDMQGERFAAATAGRIAQMYRHFVQMKQASLDLAEEAYDALTDSIEAPRRSVARVRACAAVDWWYRTLGLRH